MRSLKLCTYLLLLSSHVCASSIDGTAGVQWVTTTPSLADGEYARGFVKFTNGFTVAADATVAMNITESVAGTINLNETGTIALEGDMHIAAAAHLGAGGIIAPQGGAVIFLDGNFTIPAGVTLEFGDNAVIDGQGHELILAAGNPGGALFINGAVGTSLTLRNLTLRGLRDYAGDVSAITFGEEINQKLILENTTVWLSDDYTFDAGKLSINNSVQLKGPHTFKYQAPYDLMVRKDSTFFIDIDTIFSYVPSDDSALHLVLSSSTSRLFLNGCTVYAPSDKGLTLTKGHLIVDHKATLLSDGAASSDRTAFNFGTGLATKDIWIDVMPGAQLACNNGLFVYNNQN